MGTLKRIFTQGFITPRTPASIDSIRERDKKTKKAQSGQKGEHYKGAAGYNPKNG
jgi:hypothetical protein